MKNHLLLLSIFLISSSVLFSQTKTATIKRPVIKQYLDIGEEGFVLQSQNDKVFGHYEMILSRFSAEMDLLWEVDIPNERYSGKFHTFHMRASDGLEYVYMVERIKSEIHIYQVNNEGFLRSIKYKFNQKQQGYYEFSYCEGNNLNLLFFEKRNSSLSHEVKKQEFMNWLTINPKDLTYKNKRIMLPLSEKPNKKEYWQFGGHQDGKLILFNVLSEVDSKERISEEARVEMLLISRDGTIDKRIIEIRGGKSTGETGVFYNSNTLLHYPTGKDYFYMATLQWSGSLIGIWLHKYSNNGAKIWSKFNGLADKIEMSGNNDSFKLTVKERKDGQIESKIKIKTSIYEKNIPEPLTYFVTVLNSNKDDGKKAVLSINTSTNQAKTTKMSSINTWMNISEKAVEYIKYQQRFLGDYSCYTSSKGEVIMITDIKKKPSATKLKYFKY